MSETKAGNRNNSEDRQRIRRVRQLAREIDALTLELEPTDSDEPTPAPEVIVIAAPVKAVPTEDGQGLAVSGYLVRYSSADDPDLTGDYFAPDTDFGDAQTVPVYFNHRQPVTDGKTAVSYRSRIGTATVTRDETGLFAEVVLRARNAYERAIARLAEMGALSWSSGSAGHLVDREPDGKSHRIVSWPIVEASLTPTPAEPRNIVTAAKSLMDALETAGAVEQASETGGEQSQSVIEEESKMEIEQLTEQVKTLSEQVRTLTETVQRAPASVSVTRDEGDQPWASDGEFFKAVRTAALTGRVDPRLAAKASGANETVPSEGGFLLPPNALSAIAERMYGQGAILSRVSRDVVSGNGMDYWGVDETSRANGSRWGGVLGYWVAEGGTITATKPAWRRVSLKLNKVAAACYATSELLDDQTALQSWLTRTVPQELAFQVEDAIFEGNGAGKPLGMMNSQALVSVTRTDANKVQAVDIWNMYARRWLGGRYVWLINQAVWAQLYQLGNTYQNLFVGPSGMPGQPAATLMGLPVVEVEYASALGTTGDILLADLSQYQLIEKSGIQAATSIHVQFLTDEQVFRFVMRADGAPLWHSPLTPFKGSDTVSPFVTLSTSS